MGHLVTLPPPQSLQRLCLKLHYRTVDNLSHLLGARTQREKSWSLTHRSSENFDIEFDGAEAGLLHASTRGQILLYPKLVTS